jgi:hypothetical protein
MKQTLRKNARALPLLETADVSPENHDAMLQVWTQDVHPAGHPLYSRAYVPEADCSAAVSRTHLSQFRNVLLGWIHRWVGGWRSHPIMRKAL